jgi:ankyrin repeat protein
MLLEAGAAVGSANEDGQTALECAINAHQWEVAGRLLRSGADVEAPDKNGSRYDPAPLLPKRDA